MFGSFCSPMVSVPARGLFRNTTLRVCTAKVALWLNTLRARRICEVSQGTIKKLTDKGFGFIQGDNGDIFFHSSAVEGAGFDSLYEGQAVQYNEGNGPK